MNVRTYVYVLTCIYLQCTYVRILYHLHNSVVQGDKNETVASRESLSHLPLSQYVTHITAFQHSSKYELILRYRGYLTFSVYDQFLFHRMNTKSSIFTSGGATSENITFGVHE